MRESRESTALEEAREWIAGSPEAPVSRALLFHPWYGLATLFYMAGIVLMSSMPRFPTTRHPLLEYGLNLGHVPLFAGLTVLLIKSLAPMQRQHLTTRVCTVAALVLLAFAALDEWHQAFVPGRSPSVMDLLLDAVGIGAVLIFFRLSALVSEDP